MASGWQGPASRAAGLCTVAPWDVDWAELAELCADAYRAVAPAELVALLDTGQA